MKRVEMLTAIAGVNFSYAYGDKVVLEDRIAEDWEAKGKCRIIASVAKAGADDKQMPKVPRPRKSRAKKPTPQQEG